MLFVSAAVEAVPDRSVIKRVQEQQEARESEAMRLLQESKTAAAQPPTASQNPPVETASPSSGPMMPQQQPPMGMNQQDEENTKKKPKITLREQAFKQLLNNSYPLTPEQINRLHKRKDETEFAIATEPKVPPTPVSSTLTVDLSPGATPPVIRLSGGFVTSVVFLDATGQPWPVADYSLGNPKDFNIAWDKSTNTLFIQKLETSYGTGNLAVRLGALDTPIMLSLVSGQKEVDYRVDLRVLARGPNALPALMPDKIGGAAPSLLVGVLDGVPPPGSKELSVSGANARAWLSKGKLLLRTKLKILSPAWSASVSSADGTRVYQMSPTPLILASQDGETVKIRLTGL